MSKRKRRSNANKQTSNTTELQTTNTATHTNASPADFNLSFGDPEPVPMSGLTDYLGVFSDPVGNYYLPPILLTGLAQISRANAHHSSCVFFKRNELARHFVPGPHLSLADFRAAALDFETFGNAYFQTMTDHFGLVIRLQHLPGLNMRVKKGGGFVMLQPFGVTDIEYSADEVLHVKEYDTIQQIYGVPEWLGGIQSALLNQDATLFRRRYFLNGSHLGYILYTTDPNLDTEVEKEITEKVRQGKGVGNFRSMYLHVPNGKEKGVQVIPVGDISQRDEFERVKNISANDVLVAHRMQSALAGVKPENAGGFGDIKTISMVYVATEVQAKAQPFLDLNNRLPPRCQITFDFPDNDSM
ncbi:MAG: phage portal protein [Motiliproteus sp.]